MPTVLNTRVGKLVTLAMRRVRGLDGRKKVTLPIAVKQIVDAYGGSEKEILRECRRRATFVKNVRRTVSKKHQARLRDERGISLATQRFFGGDIDTIYADACRQEDMTREGFELADHLDDYY